MRLLLGALLLLIVALFCVGCSSHPDALAQVAPDAAKASTGANPAFRVVVCVPDYRLQALTPAQIPPATDLIYFSIEPKPTGDLDLARLQPPILQKLHDLVKNTSVRRLVALGGADRSAGFAPMATNQAARQHFEQTLTQFCLDNRLDGIDFDWEQPDNPAEEQAYAALLTEIKQRFAPNHLRLTVSLSPTYNLSKEALAAVDEVHVMAYDHDGQHSTFAQAQEDLRIFVNNGVPKSKLILGMPFYGRNVRDRNITLTYAEIVQQFHPAPSVDQIGDLYFNNIATIQQKTKYALDNGFGGVMVWELGQDATDDASLMRAIRQALTTK